MNLTSKSTLKRLAACLFGGIVLALMVGKQQGTISDFGVSFRHAVLAPRIVVFLAIGVIIFVLITFWPLVRPYLNRPGMAPLAAGGLTVVIAQTIMNWYDPLASSSGNGKFGAVANAVSQTSGISPVSDLFFNKGAWIVWLLTGVASVLAIVLARRVLGWVAAVLGVAAAVIAYLAHRDVTNVGGGIDHSLGVYADVIGFLVMAAAGVTIARATAEVADTRAFLATVRDWRPGLAYAGVAVVLGIIAFTTAGWFGAFGINLNLADAHSAFDGTGIKAIALTYLGWLGWVLFGVTALAALAATYLQHRLLALVAAVLAVVGLLMTLMTLFALTDTGASAAPQWGGRWKNLGTGGFLACIVFSLFLAAVVSLLGPARRRSPSATEGKPFTSAVERAKSSRSVRAIAVVAVAIALFYPPTLPTTWQNVLVNQIGVYVLLAVGLNVVVGWAGLLDLGYIAFFEIGSYTTAYLVGALPVKPPSWLHMTPLLTIPFSIVACLIAGVLLGAPTLRLRGDYLAIVTLGFGEIIQIVAVNNPGGFTGGPQGPTVPHPVFKLGPISITWGQDNLPYWYLLLAMLVIVCILFFRLENSALGRAWAAIREDEVAAQASGVNTTRVKLLAFAIGASTSALAGAFFATQVGYFDPSLFTLQASILIVAYVVFGGMGSLQGAIAGAAVLTWLPQFLKAQVPLEDRQMWIGALVLAMMIFRPAGLLPAKRRKAELEGLGSPASAEVSAVPASEGL